MPWMGDVTINSDYFSTPYYGDDENRRGAYLVYPKIGKIFVLGGSDYFYFEK